MNKIIEKYSQYLSQWTNKTIKEELFDSTLHNWSRETSVFDDKIIGKKNLLFIIEDETNNLFGYYLSTEIPPEYDTCIETTTESFFFTLETNGRIEHPMKFELIETWGGYRLGSKNDKWLIAFGNYAVIVGKEDKKYKSECRQYDDEINYHGISYPFCGSYAFKPKRIVVFQME